MNEDIRKQIPRQNYPVPVMSIGKGRMIKLLDEYDALEAKLSKTEETLADCLGEYERLTGIEAQAKTYIAYLGTSRAHVERAALAEALAGGDDASQ